MATFAELMRDADHRGLIRKARRAMGFIRRASEGELPEAITDESAQPIDLKAEGFKPIGLVTPEGYRFGRDVETDDVDALGYASFVRTDTLRVARTVAVNPLQFGQRHLQEIRYGMDLSGITADPDSGEIVFDEPDLPIDDEYQLVIVADDGPAANNWIFGRGYPNVKLASGDEEAWGQEVIQNALTFNVFPDDETGTPVRHYLGGTGAQASVDILGYASGS